MYIIFLFRPSLKGRIFEIGKFPTIFNNQVAISRDEMDFVRRTKMGINEIRQLRRCSRSGVCTQSKFIHFHSDRVLTCFLTIDRDDSPLAVWDYRFLKRSFCGGLWTRAAPRTRKRQAANNLVQEILQ